MSQSERKKAADISVFITTSDATCDECGEALGRSAWIMLTPEKNALCLACADLDHLLFLPSGDAALTRRAKKHSQLTAVVLRWSRARKRYERQGLLVEEAALAQAEEECLADQDARERRREREAERRAERDEQYVAQFAQRARELYPACPPGREQIIADHACRKYSGRVGRSAGAKNLETAAIHLAVAAHARHAETEYDLLLMQGLDRRAARMMISGQVETVLDRWAQPA